MKNLVKLDISYFILSRVFIWITILFCMLSAIAVYMTNSYVKQISEQLTETINFFSQGGEDINTSIQQPYVLHENGVIENPVAYYNEVLESLKNTVSMKNVFSYYFEMCTLFIPVISVLISAVLVSYDNKTKVSRLKILRYGKYNYFISKQLSGILLLFSSFLIAMVVTIVINVLNIINLSKTVDFSGAFDFSNLEIKNIMLQFVYILALGVISFEICYILCNLTHAYTVIAVLISAASLFLTPLFKYDLMNIKCNFETALFDFNGVIQSGEPITVSLSIAGIEILLIFIIMFVINMKVSKGRSAYN